MNNETNIKWR